MNRVPLGAIGTCASCNRVIQHTGRYWEHVGGQYRHPAVPRKPYLKDAEQKEPPVIHDPIKEHAQAMATIERVFERGQQAEKDLRSLLAALMIPRNREMLESADPRVREVIYEQFAEPIAERWNMK